DVPMTGSGPASPTMPNVPLGIRPPVAKNPEKRLLSQPPPPPAPTPPPNNKVLSALMPSFMTLSAQAAAKSQALSISPSSTEPATSPPSRMASKIVRPTPENDVSNASPTLKTSSA